MKKQMMIIAVAVVMGVANAEELLTAQWFRFTIKQTYSANNCVAFSELALYDADGKRLNAGLSEVKEGTNPLEMAPGSCCTPKAYATASWETAAALFDGTASSKFCAPNLSGMSSAASDPTKWLLVTMRLAEESAVSTYDLCTAGDGVPSRNPTHWLLEYSKDGSRWFVADERGGENGPETTRTWYSATRAEGVRYPVAVDPKDKPETRTVVTIPTVAPKALDGGTVFADIWDTETYTVSGNTGWSEPGIYMLTLTLTDVDKYVWSDGTDAPATVQFVLDERATGVRAEWFRFTVKQTYSDKTVLQYSELALYDVNKRRVNLGYGGYRLMAPGMDPVGLNAQECCMAAAYSCVETANSLFDGDLSTKWCCTGLVGMDEAFPDPAQWRTIVFRIPPSATKVAYYDLATAGDATPPRNPTHWVLEYSKDGRTWKVCDKRSGENGPTENKSWYSSVRRGAYYSINPQSGLMLILK